MKLPVIANKSTAKILVPRAELRQSWIARQPLCPAKSTGALAPAKHGLTLARRASITCNFFREIPELRHPMAGPATCSCAYSISRDVTTIT